jgi:hypothetical protein
VQEKRLFEYAVVRLVPCVERQEFLNVGIIVYCPDEKILMSKTEPDEARILHLCPTVDMREVREHLNALERICAGGESAGPIGVLPVGERFRWLTAPRSTIVQTSPVHTGLCSDAAETMERLLDTMVR